MKMRCAGLDQYKSVRHYNTVLHTNSPVFLQHTFISVDFVTQRFDDIVRAIKPSVQVGILSNFDQNWHTFK